MDKAHYSNAFKKHVYILSGILLLLIVIRNIFAPYPAGTPAPFTYLDAVILAVFLGYIMWVLSPLYLVHKQVLDSVWYGALFGLTATAIVGLLYALLGVLLPNQLRQVPEMVGLAEGAATAQLLAYNVKALIGFVSVGTLLGAFAGFLPYVWASLVEEEQKPASSAPKKAVAAEKKANLTPVHTLWGVSKDDLSKLYAAGIEYVETLRERGATRSGRKELQKDTKLSQEKVMRLVNMSDLMRIKGVTGPIAALLEASGIDTVVELSKRSAQSLGVALKETNKKRKIVASSAMPAKEDLEGFIQEAKKLPRALEF